MSFILDLQEPIYTKVKKSDRHRKHDKEQGTGERQETNACWSCSIYIDDVFWRAPTWRATHLIALHHFLLITITITITSCSYGSQNSPLLKHIVQT